MIQMETFMTLYLPKYTSANQPANTYSTAVTTPFIISESGVDWKITSTFATLAVLQAHVSKLHTITRTAPFDLTLLARYIGLQ